MLLKVCRLHTRQAVMLLAWISFRAQPHKRSEILSAVDATIERLRRASGCVKARLLADTEDPNAFILVSEWLTIADADAFFDSREFQIFRGMRMLLRDEPTIILDNVQTRVTRLMTSR